ncbi:MAG: DNA polymerase IV [Spirochaetales bacterium]|nr:DNA polymerase IV [Spirochaetales bacterium]
MKNVSKYFFHVDLDAFYASVEQADNPEYRGKPVIIGALPGHRGVVAACSYEARKFGVHSAMPISHAYRLCPGGIYLPVRMHRYQELSGRVMDILKNYTPALRQISIDEASMDMSGTARLFGPPEEAAAGIKRKIREETGLTLSIGIAPNRYLAKLASEKDKPDGLYEIKTGEEESFIETLELKDIWGLGQKMRERLTELNILTVQDLKKFPERMLRDMVGKAAGSYLYRVVRGIDPGIYNDSPKSRSMSSEITFEQDSRDTEGMKNMLLDISHQLMFRIMQHEYRAKTVELKIRYEDFSTISGRKTVRHYINSAEEIYALALELLEARRDSSRAVRLIGLGVSSLEEGEEPAQKELFQDGYDRKKMVEEAVFRMQKQGSAVVKASLLKQKNEKKKPFERN